MCLTISSRRKDTRPTSSNSMIFAGGSTPLVEPESVAGRFIRASRPLPPARLGRAARFRKKKSTSHLIGFDVPGVMLIDDLLPAAATWRHECRSLRRPSRGATWIGRPVPGGLAGSRNVTLRSLSQLGLAPSGNHDGPTPTKASFIVASHRCLPVRQVATPGHAPGRNEGP
jgi:hypothetical protein